MKIGKKYRLKASDQARFRELMAKECFDLISLMERLELDRLMRKRSRLLRGHPKIKAAMAVYYRKRRRTREIIYNFKTLQRSAGKNGPSGRWRRPR